MKIVILITVLESSALMLWLIHSHYKRNRAKLAHAVVHPPARLHR